MSKSSPKPPPAPDPYAVAQAQYGTNVNTGIANSIMSNPNVVGPYGSTTYSQSGTTNVNGQNIPRYTQTTTLSPEQQQLYNQQTQLGSGLNNLAIGQVDRLSNHLGNPLDLSGLPSVANDFSADRQRVEQSMYDRMAPQLQSQENQLRDRLINQGLQPGTEAWINSMNDYNRGVNDLRLGITGQGLQEQQGLFGMQQANRSRALQEMLQERNQPINEISALMSGGQVSMPNQPGYTPGQVGQTDLAGNIYNSAALNQANYNTQMQQQNSAMGGMFGLGQAAILGGMKYGPAIFASDRRLKDDIIDLGIRLMNGAKLYAYRYIGQTKRRVGVMADELQAIRPDAVIEHNGYLAVNYGRL
jgi:hypothetical protein